MMSTNNIEKGQRLHARVAGAALLVIILCSLLSNELVVSGDAGATAANIMSHERQFRMGLFGELVMINADIVLALVLYGLFRPVSGILALLGAFWRIANVILQAFGVVIALVAVDILRDTHYPDALSADALHATMRQFLDIHGTAMLIGLIFFGLGAATHAYLFWKSRYIPRVLSGAYMAVATVILVCSLAIVIFPSLDAIIDPWFILPDFVVELSVALWLLIKGIKVSSNGGNDTALFER